MSSSYPQESGTSTLEDLLLLNPSALGYLYDRIGFEYQRNPSNFADNFFEVVEQMNPKSVRIVCYQLLSLGTNLETLYNQRTVEDVPEFLYRLNTFPNETMLVLLKYGFPPYPGGNHYLWYSIDEFASTSISRTINRLNWLDFNLDLNILLSLDLDHLNRDGQTLLQSAIQKGLTSVVIKLLMRRANPNLTVLGNEQTTLDLTLDLVEQNDIQGTLPNLLLIIKQLVRYGLDVGTYQQTLHQDRVEAAVNAGKQLKPLYINELPPYLEADRIEDLAVMSVIDPSVIEKEGLSPERRGKFLEAVKVVQDQTVVSSDGTIVAWPKAIDASHPIQIEECPVEQLTVESPFKPDEVYALALRGLPNLKRTPPTFSLVRETTTSNEQIYRFPQPTAKVGFMGLPPLVSRDSQPSIESIRRWPGPISAIFERTGDPNGFVQSIPPDELIVERGFSSSSAFKTAPGSDLMALLPLATGPIRPTATPSLPTLPIPAH